MRTHRWLKYNQPSGGIRTVGEVGRPPPIAIFSISLFATAPLLCIFLSLAQRGGWREDPADGDKHSHRQILRALPSLLGRPSLQPGKLFEEVMRGAALRRLEEAGQKLERADGSAPCSEFSKPS